jgi:hypothetical protein
VLIVLLTPLSIYLCGQAAWMMRTPTDEVEIRSSLTADYSPWTTAFFPSLDPSILMAALLDRDEGGLFDTRRAMNCFLLTSGCERVSEGGLQDMGATATPLRIANNVEPDLTQPDGQGLLIKPGREVILDLRSAPILVIGSEEPAADLLIYIIEGNDGTAHIEISIAETPEGTWIPVFFRGDQPHGDMELELPYSSDNEVFGENQPPSTSSDDAFVQGWIGFGLDVDASVTEPGLYGWLRIGIEPDAAEPVALDAVIVVNEAE